jgi:phenylpropionate dioxygenase-like ring-hydroxylating dioxygenase large terminal subunit
MVETVTGTNRSAGVSYSEVLDRDSHPVRDILRVDNPLPPGPTIVDPKVYYSREVFEREKERLWKRVWQMACHEDDIPNVGDAIVYDIADLSYMVVRSAEDEFHAFPNACLHRGRQILHQNEERLHNLRCAFHGWSWGLDGELQEVPCHWDFPTVSKETHSLKQVKVGRWGGFVFINPDPDCEPLEDFLGNLDEHMTLLPMERRYKAVHVAKRLPCNWKVAHEAFAEAYHSVATHPTLLSTLGCANSKYDIFGNFSRALSAHHVGSPHVPSWLAEHPYLEATPFTKQRHELTGSIYERVDDGRVKVTTTDNRVGYFDDRGNHIDGEKFHDHGRLCRKACEGGCRAARRAAQDSRRQDGRGERRGAARSHLLQPVPQRQPLGVFQPDLLPFPTLRRQPGGVHPRVSVHVAGSRRTTASAGGEDAVAGSGR